jgi:hypothetical protein
VDKCQNFTEFLTFLEISSRVSPEARIAEKCWAEIVRLREYEFMYKGLCE